VGVVYDPVLRSGHGSALSREGLVEAVRGALREGAVEVLTPNVPEAEALLGEALGSRGALLEAAEALVTLGARGVLLKGGHLDGSGDAWAWRGAGGVEVVWLANEVVVPGLDVHGTGCHLSTALACGLAHGLPASEAARAARAFLAARVREGLWRPGKGREVLR
jgi:hydroxymethylpyrimidine/phosphomethylpyrimidine kinase